MLEKDTVERNKGNSSWKLLPQQCKNNSQLEWEIHNDSTSSSLKKEKQSYMKGNKSIWH